MASTRATERWFFIPLLVWGLGTQIDEALASVGMWGCAAVAGLQWSDHRPPLRGLLLVVRSWWPLVAFLAWAVFAPLLAGRLPTATGVARAMDWLGVPIAAYALSALEPRARKQIAVAVGGVFLLSCAVAGFQHFGIWPGPEFFAHFAWTHLPFQRAYEPVPGVAHRFMGCGLPLHRLKFAHIGGLVVLFALVWGFNTARFLRFFSFATAAIGFFAILFFPYARAASVALIFAGLIAIALARRRRKVLLLLGLALLAVSVTALVVDAPLRLRFSRAATDSGSGNRLGLLQTGLNAVRAHPLLGVGLGNFRPSKFATPDTPQSVLDHPGKAHNQFVTIAAEIGLPGSLLFCALLAWLAASMGRHTPEGISGLATLAFFVQLSLFHDPLFHGQFAMAFALALGAALSRNPVRAPTLRL